ncbi:MAG: extracellular solute-binding protein [Candidatus Competibacteraceae bacterium]
MSKNDYSFWLIVVFVASQLTICMPALSSEERETLRVLLYPYVPNKLSLFQKIEKDFEKDNPGVNLELVDTSDLIKEYYSGGLQESSADVYEVDTVLLSDMIKLGKISKISFAEKEFSHEAVAAVSRNGATYAVPHWLCGNFLFYRKEDNEIANAKSWNDIEEILKNRHQALFVDFKGKSTLGEWYLTVLSEIQGVDSAQQSIIKSDTLNPEVTKLLNSILNACPDGFCRNIDLHNRTGYYSRAFISGKANAYVGYSESIYYGIQYSIDNCIDTSGCLSVSNIAVRKLPSFRDNPVSNGLGWVDALAIDSSLTGKKRELAISFINYLTSEKAYKSILEPEWMEAPRYLIPARINLEINEAPLYKSFLEANSGRETGTLLGLNDKLKSIGKKLDCAMPINRTDSETKKECQP